MRGLEGCGGLCCVYPQYLKVVDVNDCGGLRRVWLRVRSMEVRGLWRVSDSGLFLWQRLFPYVYAA